MIFFVKQLYTQYKLVGIYGPNHVLQVNCTVTLTESELIFKKIGLVCSRLARFFFFLQFTFLRTICYYFLVTIVLYMIWPQLLCSCLVSS